MIKIISSPRSNPVLKQSHPISLFLISDLFYSKIFLASFVFPLQNNFA